VGVDAFPPVLFAAIRFTVAAIPAVFFVGRPCVRWRWIVLIGLSLGAGQYALLFTAIHLGMPAGLSSVVLQTQAVFTIAIAAATLGERVTVRQLVGLVVAFAGILLVGLDLDQSSPLPAFLLCLVAAACWGLGNVGIRKARPSNMLNLMVWISVVPPVPLFLLSLALEGPRADLAAITHVDTAGLGAIVYIAYLSTLLAFGLWGWLIRTYDASLVAPYSLLVPIFSLSATAVFLNERLTPVRLLAAVLVVGGIAVASLRLRRPSRARLNPTADGSPGRRPAEATSASPRRSADGSDRRDRSRWRR
jgi:O-acetylserine/cysteine efflux transporter